MDLVDGFEELPEDMQVKVKRAIEQGHVDDEGEFKQVLGFDFASNFT